MSPPGQRRSLGGESQASSGSFAGDTPSIPATDLTTLSPRERRLWLEGYQWGRVSGIEDGYARGWAACDEELARLQREAHRVVMTMAGLDARPLREAS